MTIIINHKQAALKKDSSFEYIAENSFFTDADSYTLSITFPLRGCQQNIDIFGYINRKDHNLDTLLLDCEIHDRDFHVYGSVSIVEISDIEVKTQFLLGRSANNFYCDLDDLYINEIAIGSVIDSDLQGKALEDGCVPSYYPTECPGYIHLPWVNNTSGNIQNGVAQREVTTGKEWYYTAARCVRQYYLP